MKRNITSDSEVIRAYSAAEHQTKDALIGQMLDSPIPREELQGSLVLFQDRRVISRILFVNELYQHIIGLHGCIMEFGVRYGPNLALFTSLRGIHEPYNHVRKVIGFDTFSGFPGTHPSKDPSTSSAGDYAVPEDYEKFLETNLATHESMAPLANIRKFELVKGDATATVPAYLAAHPETLISLAYFDLDLYEPTKVCLEAILPYLTRGAVIGFDELAVAAFPGEMEAVREVFADRRFTFHHSPYRAAAAYVIYE
ncbi:MAG: CalS11 [Gemmatimonadetes bacterium]|nr:CalS11 [Gemmatimonadota bacterium]